MSRLTWNDCCCGPAIGLTGDMVLVRAGWYHFLVMTLDGRINCFIGSGLEGQENDTYGGYSPTDTRGWGFWNYDWMRVNKSEVFSDLSTNGRATEAYNPNGNPDKAFWSLEETVEDIAIHVPADSVRQDGSLVLYNCSQRDVYPAVNSLFPLNKGICVNGGCWYERNQIKAFDGVVSNPNSNFYDWYWPHGYLEFDGSGCTAARPYKIDGVTSERWQYLVTKKYGTFANFGSVNFSNYCNGITGITMVEEYKPPVKPAPVGHPLHVPTIPTITEDGITRSLKVIDIECGAYHNIIRLEDNTIMCWGLNSMGQCNVPDSLKPGSASPHPKLNKIFSIHAGFSNTAVLFNDGTALCWGDPEVACAVNNWTDIRVSPIKRHNGQPGESSSCKGASSTGYPDPNNPEYPANKYDNPTYNANTDWFKYWRTGTPGYPHFDLGVEVDPIYPVNWGGLIVDYLKAPINAGCNLFEPKSWCAECQDATSGMSIGKDFAVGMRRTGQIITSKKGAYTNPENSNLYSRDCSFDSSSVYQVSSGTVNPGDIGPNYNNIKFCCGGSETTDPNTGKCPSWCGPDEPGDCRDYLVGQGVIQKCNSSYPCSAKDRWSLTSAYADFCGTKIKPIGIGCFNSKYGEYGYDPNWAVTSNKYQAGKQVIPNGFAGHSRYPTWNTIDASYGWSTLVVETGRSKSSTRSNSFVPYICQADGLEATYCVMDKGQNEACNQFCPSDPGFKWSSALGNVAGRRGDGVPGYFRYPLHMATALTCIAGTNTVGWISSAQTLGRDLTKIGTAKDYITDSAAGKCDQYHWMGNTPVDCSECAYVGGNAASHTDEVGKVEYGCIFAQPSGQVPPPPNTNKDKNGINNPFSEDSYNQACLPSPEQIQDDWGFPTKPWGPWNITTNIGFATPSYIDLAVCAVGIKSTRPYVSYKSSGTGLDGSGDLLNVPWRTPLGPGMPSWFMNSCVRDLRQFSYYGTIYGGSFPTTHTSKLSVVVTGLCPDEIFGPGQVTLQKDCYELKKPENCGCNPRGISYLWTCDESLFACNDNTKWAVDAKPDVDFRYPGRAGGNGVPSLPAVTYQEVVNRNKFPRLSGQQGFTCEAGTQDTISRWCWNNPIISYATGRSFGVHIRACPWTRGLSGEFVWKESCKDNNEYFNKISQFGFNNSTSRQTKSLKLWVSGILEDPCPPWPVSVNLNGITCGVYPSWVPVPSTNTTKRADKGEWTYSVTTWPGCAASWGYTLGCEISWPSGITGCTATDNCASSI